MGCKGVGVAYQQTFHGHNQLKNWMTYACVAVLVICIFVQMNFLNRALDVYNTTVVTPIYYVFFTTCVVVGSIVLYKEFFTMSKEEIISWIKTFLRAV
jgi:protein-S-isoprenylcysteine O-methyltransferase Ste14